MTQVVFNLLENAIKYQHNDRTSLNMIEIIGAQTDDNYTITFRDQGIGVPKGWEEKIFLQNVRGPTSHLYDVSGEGFGLWFSREIIKRHDGQLLLASRKNPTEFLIILPAYLENQAPIENYSRENIE